MEKRAIIKDLKKYNNGIIHRHFQEGMQPEGWELGVMEDEKESRRGVNCPWYGKIGEENHNYGTVYYNNGEIEIRCLSGNQPREWSEGRLEAHIEKTRGKNNGMFGKLGSAAGKNWYNNGVDESYFRAGEESNGWVEGRLCLGENHHFYGRDTEGINNPNYGNRKYINPESGEKKMFKEGDQPDNWLRTTNYK